VEQNLNPPKSREKPKPPDNDNARDEQWRDPQDQSTDEQEPIRQQNRYDPGRRHPR